MPREVSVKYIISDVSPLELALEAIHVLVTSNETDDTDTQETA